MKDFTSRSFTLEFLKNGKPTGVTESMTNQNRSFVRGLRKNVNKAINKINQERGLFITGWTRWGYVKGTFNFTLLFEKTADLTLTFLTLIHPDEGVLAQGNGPKKTGTGFNNQIAQQQVKISDMIYHLTKITINEKGGGGKPDISAFKTDLSDVNSVLSNVPPQPPQQDID